MGRKWEGGGLARISRGALRDDARGKRREEVKL